MRHEWIAAKWGKLQVVYKWIPLASANDNFDDMDEKIQQTELCTERRQAVERLAQAVRDKDRQLDDILWDTLILFEGYTFYTAKGLDFSYTLRGYEMFVTRKAKSITRASVMIAFHRALRLGDEATGPKKLGTFGASYLYPILVTLGVIGEKH